MRLDRDELRRLLVGPFGVLPTPFDKDYELDLGAMHSMVQRIVDAGVSRGNGVIKVASAVGEGPMLRDDEWPNLLRTAVQAADGKVPVMLGLHYKDTKRTIEDAKQAQDLGAIALQITPPIFNVPTQNDVYDFFYDVGNAIDIGIMVYVTNWMVGGQVEVDTILRMVNIDRVVAIKWGGPDYEKMTRFAHIFNVIDNSVNPVRCHKLGGRGWVQSTLDVNPEHDLKVWDLLEAGRHEEAEALYRSVQAPLRAFGTKVGKRTGGQSVVHKGLAEVMGRSLGPSRPPTKTLNDREMVELRDIVERFGWPVAELS